MPCQQNSAGRMSLPALELVKKSIFDKLSNETHFVSSRLKKLRLAVPIRKSRLSSERRLLR